MQIVIPMSGFGERFRRAGYTVPKPLIEVDSKTIIQHVVEMYPGENDFTFICNQDHLDNPDYKMREILELICPTGRIVGIAPHKLGPVYAVQQIIDHLNADEPTIVNYCDFTCYWNYADFKSKVLETGCDGSIPSYRVFIHTFGVIIMLTFLKRICGPMIFRKKPLPITHVRNLHPVVHIISNQQS